ncbi:MAG: HAD hydrolase family protein [Bacteroidales bacterium]|nr:HAD hydrolase family protein [Bacteroidales bacterium]
MVFASDLDQTLIYSENFLDKYHSNAEYLKENKISIIEYYKGAPLTYIHNQIVSPLQQLDSMNKFVPVTTRTEEQYRRIDFNKYGINPCYAITTNGAKVLKNGVIDLEWKQKTHAILSSLTTKPADIAQMVPGFISSDAIKTIRTAEDSFCYCVLHMENLDKDEVQKLKSELNPEEWKISLQGRKLYFVPAVISKWLAIEYVCDKIGDSQIISAGDSLLDLPMLINSDLGLVPGHGEIASQKLYDKYNLSCNEIEGVDASVAILDEVIRDI